MTRVFDGEMEFRFHRPSAERVSLVGDFNNWDKVAAPMSRQPNGDWCCRLRLPEGAYQFRYYADGKWYTEKTDLGIQCCPFECNSILVTSCSDLCGVPL